MRERRERKEISFEVVAEDDRLIIVGQTVIVIALDRFIFGPLLYRVSRNRSRSLPSKEDVINAANDDYNNRWV